MSREVHVRFSEGLGVQFPRPTQPYIPWRRGHLYLVAMIDWKTRAVLAWRVSNTMDVESCLHLAKMFPLMMGEGERPIRVIFCSDVLRSRGVV